MLRFLVGALLLETSGVNSGTELAQIGFPLIKPTENHEHQLNADETRLEISEEEALLLWNKVQTFVRERGQKPDLRSHDPLERRLAEALLFIQKRRRELGE